MTSDSDATPETQDASDDQPSATDRIVAAFGGIRPMAHKLGMPVTTVQGWKKRGAIPQQRHETIRDAAREHGIELDDAALIAAAHSDAQPEPAHTPRRPTPQAAPTPEPFAGDTKKPVPGPAPRRPAVAWAALVLALIALAAAATAPLWTGPIYGMAGMPIGPGATTTIGEQAPLEARLDDLERRTETLAAQSGTGDEFAALTTRLQAVDQQLAAQGDRVTAVGGAVDALAVDIARLDGALGNQRIGLTEALAIVTSLQGRADAIEARLEEIATIQGRDGRRIDRLVASDSATQALVLAIGQLRVAVDAGQPYGQPLASLQALSAGIDEAADDLAALAPGAPTGISDRDALKSDFPAMAQEVRDAVLLPADARWWDQAIAKVEGLVTVRPAPGEVDGEDVGAILARAEGRLETNDLGGAVAAIALLEGEAAGAAASWRQRAEARLAAEAALGNLTSFAIARLANIPSDR